MELLLPAAKIFITYRFVTKGLGNPQQDQRLTVLPCNRNMAQAA